MDKYTAMGVALFALMGCSKGPSPLPGPIVYFRPQQTWAGLVYRTVPYPNDLYTSATGNAIAPSSDPNLSRSFLNTSLIPMMDQCRGFGTSSAVLFRRSLCR
ncbi:MAG: hypothetical protein M1517_07795 [Deltaproteobacteria bacterium]|nr:hypothetical protein [Deltaproteobacteria bacterium]